MSKVSYYTAEGLKKLKDELDHLKSDSIFWYSVWRNAGRPASGHLHNIKISTNLK